MIYCAADVPKSGDTSVVSPKRICDDLTKRGFNVWFPGEAKDLQLEEIAIKLKSTKLILLAMSDNFVNDSNCCKLFHYIGSILRKQRLLVVLGEAKHWNKSQIGMTVASEVYVSFSNPTRYDAKIMELADTIQKRLESTTQQRAPCFISYCWTNSHDAVKKGSRGGGAGSLGWADPRALRDHLESHGVPCWMDIEQVGRGGLFEDIAEGLKHAKVFIACVSNEYAKSRNCQMEFRFANITLRVPMILAVVGSGTEWETSEVGMLSLGAPKVSFQHESPTAYNRLLETVKQHLPDTPAESVVKQTQSDPSKSDEAYSELLELAQRKFLRQLEGYVSESGHHDYPHLLVMDFDETKPPEPERDVTAEGEGEQPRRRLQRRSSVLQAGLERGFVRVLCEHEAGWHCAGAPVPLPGNGQDQLVELVMDSAPYTARVLALLKHGGHRWNILTSQRGAHIQAALEGRCEPEMNFSAAYNTLRQHTITADVTHSRGGLARCHLPTGRQAWLCEEHRRGDRITVLDDYVTTPTPTSTSPTNEENASPSPKAPPPENEDLPKPPAAQPTPPKRPQVTRRISTKPADLSSETVSSASTAAAGDRPSSMACSVM